MTKEKLEKDKKNRSCLMKYCGIEAKKNVSCINLVAMFLIFLMGGMSGNGTVLQSVYLLGSAEGKDEDAVTDYQDTVYSVGRIELYYVLASVISAPLIGYLYEMTSRRLVLGLSLLLLGCCLLITEFGDDEKGIWTAASVLTGTFMYALMGNPLIMDYIKKYSRGRIAAL